MSGIQPMDIELRRAGPNAWTVTEVATLRRIGTVALSDGEPWFMVTQGVAMCLRPPALEAIRLAFSAVRLASDAEYMLLPSR